MVCLGLPRRLSCLCLYFKASEGCLGSSGVLLGPSGARGGPGDVPWGLGRFWMYPGGVLEKHDSLFLQVEFVKLLSNY